MECIKLKLERFNDKYKDCKTMFKYCYDLFENFFDKRDKIGFILMVSNYISLFFFVLAISFYFQFILLLIYCLIIKFLFSLLIYYIYQDIIVPDKIKQLYNTGYLISGYFEIMEGTYYKVRDIIKEEETVDSYINKIRNEFNFTKE